MIRVGFIGCGRIADLHYLGYQDNPDAKLAAVCDVSEEAVKTRCREWHVDKGYTDYRDLLADPDIDAVEVLTPQPLHDPMMIEAVQAGKHVACQKPMTISLDSADRMIKAAADAGVTFKVSDNFLFYPPIVLAKKMIDDGLIGAPSMLRMKFIGGLEHGGWDVPGACWAWRLQEANEGRGIQTFDHGHHLWAVAWHLLGDIERVSAWIDHTGVIDSPAVIMWKYRNQTAYGVCDYCQAMDLPIPSKYYACDEWFEITGSRGIILVRRCSGNLLDGPAVSTFTQDGWKHYELESDWASGFVRSTQNFINAIKGAEAPLLTGAQAKEILRFAFALQKSNKDRREINLDPD